MDWLNAWGVAMGTAWLSGFRLYASVLTLGLLQHFGYATLPGDLRIFGDWWVIAIAGLMCIMEFIADKIPAIDSTWDAVHTFIRIPAGAVIAAAAFGQFDTRIRVLAFILGGGIAFTAHGTKATTRLAVNTSPEPFSNIAVSAVEDTAGVGLSLLAAFHPVIMLIIVAGLVVIGVLVMRKILRGVQGLLNRLRFHRV